MTPKIRQLSLLVFILVLAAFLRFYLLDGQSFWNDEGNSARIAERSLQLITEGAAGDIHMPEMDGIECTGEESTDHGISFSVDQTAN